MHMSLFFMLALVLLVGLGGIFGDRRVIVAFPYDGEAHMLSMCSNVQGYFAFAA